MSENFDGIFAAVASVLKADLSLDIKETINHAKKNLDENGIGSAFFGSTGCGQLISIKEKKEFIDVGICSGITSFCFFSDLEQAVMSSIIKISLFN